MRTYLTEFEVVGRGAFPLDMLRYDACFPSRSDDVFHIEPDSRRNNASERRVRLIHVGITKGWQPETGRWSSFGWSVDPASYRNGVMS